jgi:hypothetical protein
MNTEERKGRLIVEPPIMTVNEAGTSLSGR